MISENILFAIESQMYGIFCLKILLLLPLLTLSKTDLINAIYSTQELKYNWQVEIIREPEVEVKFLVTLYSGDFFHSRCVWP